MTMRNDYRYPKYVSVAEKRDRAEKKLRQLRRKNPDLAPVILQGSKLAASWWGKAWNDNLEGYADYSNRIGRGRSYLRQGAVLDLKIEPGAVTALVQGSVSTPYTVKIAIDPMKQGVWQAIVDQCRGAVDSLETLLDGSLPRNMEASLTRRGQGIFPSPGEIRFRCSCPDRASLCKHVAAALYGVGARLDADPSLLFVLRNIAMKDLVSSVVGTEARALLEKADTRKSARIIRDADLSSAFGIDIEDSPLPGRIGPGKPGRRRPPGSPAPAGVPEPGPGIPPAKSSGTAPPEPPARIGGALLKKPGRPANPVSGNGAAPRRPLPGEKASAGPTPYETVVGIIRRRRVKGIGFQELKERTGLEDTLLRNIIQRARQRKEITNQERGLYIRP
jgi:uncharacterized Zn finger protein